MTLSAEGRALIQKHEKCRLKAYRPTPNDIWTIGWGHTGPDVYEGREITQAEADTIFDADIMHYTACVESVCAASPLQHAAMVSLCYNIGVEAFKRSSVARLHNAGQYPEAAQAFSLWNKQKGVVLRELVSRRAEEAAMYVEGSPTATDDLIAEVIKVHGHAEGEQPLADSRTMNGGNIALAATTAGAAVSQVPSFVSSLPDYSNLLLQIMPYAGKAALAFAGVAVLGIAYSMYARAHDRSTGRS